MNLNSANAWKQLGQASMAGVTLAACIFTGTGMGVVLDRWLGTRPWFTLLLLVMGIVAGFWNALRIIASLGISSPKK